MGDVKKSKAELQVEVAKLRKRIAVLEKKASAEEKSGEEILRAFMNALSEPALLINIDYTVILANDAAASAISKSPSEIMGRNILRFLPRKLANNRKTYIDQAIKTGEVLQFEDSQNEKTYINYIHPVINEKKEVTKIAILAIDITERKRKEEKLQKKEAHQELVLNSLPLAYYVAQPFGDYGGIEVSDQIHKICGFKRDQFVANINLWASRLHPDDRKAALEEYGKIVEKGEVKLEYRWKAADGKYLWFLDQAVLIRDKKGKPKEIIGTWLDITERKQEEFALKEREERLNILFEYAPDAYYLNDTKGTFIDGNKAAEKLTGYKKSELIGKSFANLKLLAPKQLKKALNALGKNIQGKPTGPEEFTLIRKDRSQVEVEIQTYPVKIKGKPFVLGIARDITERKKAEVALRESESKFRNIVESSPMGMHMYELQSDNKLVFIDANAAADRILGVKNKQFIGKTIEEAFPPLKDTEVPERYRLAASKGKNWKTEQINYEYGKIRGAYEVYAFQTTPERMAVMFLDITDRKRAEEALRESEERFSLFMSHLPAIVFMKDNKSRTIYVNKYMNDVLGAKDWIDKTPLELFPKKIAEQMITDDEQVFHKGYERIIEKVPDKKGVERIFQTSKFTIKRQKNTPLLGGIALDITKQQQAEDKLKESLKEKDVMLREIHHRVKNNMQIISSLLRLQSREIKDTVALEKFEDSQNRIKAMAFIHDSLYRSEDLSNINFSDYVNKIAFHLYAQYRQVKDRVKLRLDLMDILLDINRAIPCGQIINELLTNSLKHAFPQEKNGEIIIQMKIDKKGKKTLVIKDTGIGFPEDLDFVKADSLGLQMVNDLVGQLEGTIVLDRKSGTAFTITF
jgi:PAS domain S-box-containing protein